MDMLVNIVEEKEPEQKGQRGEKLPGADPLIPLQSYGHMSTNTNPTLSSIYLFHFLTLHMQYTYFYITKKCKSSVWIIFACAQHLLVKRGLESDSHTYAQGVSGSSQ